MMQNKAIATPRLTLVVHAGRSSWHGRGVQLEVWKVFSWTQPPTSYLRRRGRETLPSFFIFYVSLLMHSRNFSKSPVFSIVKLTKFLGSFGSDHCQRAGGMLLCQSYFPLCDCESGHSYMASREECERISMVECEEEWTNARQYGIPLPNCTDLPEEVTSENQL